MSSAEQQPANQNLSTLLQLEAEARRAESVTALHFLMVNETRRLISYRQAFYISVDQATSPRVEAASSLSVVDRNAPLVSWLETAVAGLADKQSTHRLDAGSFSERSDSFEKFSLPHVLFCPVQLADGRQPGGLWLARETPWEDSELVLIERLAETYAHAMNALAGPKGLRPLSSLSRKLLAGCGVLLLAAAVIPVRMSAIAPVEIVAADPVVVSAPMDGVIDEVIVPPNSPVEAGTVLFRFEDTNHRNRFEIAEQSYQVANTRLRTATQGAFQNDAERGQMALLQAELALKQAELAYARDLLGQVSVRAATAGLVVYTDPSDWIGRPVAVGEKVMEIVDPARVKFRITLPVDDAIVLEPGAEVDVFLHANPLSSIAAVVTRASFNATPTPAGVLAYELDAVADAEESPGRLGLQGSARVHGEKVSLLFYLFRRPFSSVRQFLGL